MKRFSLIFCVFLILFTLSSCKDDSQAINVNAGLSQADFFPGGSGGESVVIYKNAQHRGSEKSNLVNQNISPPPVFADKYPMGQGGPEYKVTQEINELVLNNYKDFIKHLGLEGELPEYENPEGWQLQAFLENEEAENNEKTHLVAGVNSLSVNILNFGIDSNTSTTEINSLISENDYVAAICDLASIKKPYVEKQLTYNNEGNLSSTYFFIFEESEDVLTSAISKNLNCAEIVISEGSDRLSVRARFVDQIEPDFGLAHVSYEDAVRRVLADKPDFSQADINACELVYNASLVKGYLIPCYMFYLDGGIYTDSLAEQTGSESNLVQPRDDLKNDYIYYVAAIDLTDLAEKASEAAK